jgi:hypothetical protein
LQAEVGKVTLKSNGDEALTLIKMAKGKSVLVEFKRKML